MIVAVLMHLQLPDQNVALGHHVLVERGLKVTAAVEGGIYLQSGRSNDQGREQHEIGSSLEIENDSGQSEKVSTRSISDRDASKRYRANTYVDQRDGQLSRIATDRFADDALPSDRLAEPSIVRTHDLGEGDNGGNQADEDADPGAPSGETQTGPLDRPDGIVASRQSIQILVGWLCSAGLFATGLLGLRGGDGRLRKASSLVCIGGGLLLADALLLVHMYGPTCQAC